MSTTMAVKTGRVLSIAAAAMSLAGTVDATCTPAWASGDPASISTCCLNGVSYGTSSVVWYASTRLGLHRPSATGAAPLPPHPHIGTPTHPLACLSRPTTSPLRTPAPRRHEQHTDLMSPTPPSRIPTCDAQTAPPSLPAFRRRYRPTTRAPYIAPPSTIAPACR